MNVLIYGAGIQGSFLAHSLNKGMNHVTLLARGKKKDKLITDGLVLQHTLQRKQTKDQLRVIDTLKADDHYDIIFVTMKYSDFPQVIDSLARNSSSLIVFVGNQVNPAALAAELQKKSLEKKEILFGFQMTGGTNTSNGTTVLHFGKGKMKIGSISSSFTATKRLDTLFAKTDYSWQYEAQMVDWLESHALLIMIQNSYEYVYSAAPKKEKTRSQLDQLAQAMKEAVAVMDHAQIEILPKKQKYLFSHPALTKSLFTIYYQLPISQMVQGDFKEVYYLIRTFMQYSLEKQPTLKELLTQAKEKYEATI
ncbi:ketopantoate reductase family protein [Enterococcus hermanniensis]|uniref:Ketopantoate reductase N-terminal domain-containing protein n=1 Tax=Enterococcus hermanniensis TaxID=249189 RepID=A0A1L8TP49_9ENTE|nr:2-dehydropantoate 2-reductase N-terminal domain-containing protein [Enterococcus hermanniensis]OJG45938.1 hypothetical protein RV04_GL001704 [Enterococcus hermanniensis]